MNTYSRTNLSLLGGWWLSLDRWNIAALIALAAVGAVLGMAASPPVAEHLGKDTFYFAQRHIIFLPIALAGLLAVSALKPQGVRILALAVFAGALGFMALTLVTGAEIKGATRWVSIAGFSLQPSEFVKPSFAVLSAWLFARWRLGDNFTGYALAIGLYVLVVLLLLVQPDVGMTILVSIIWGTQFFLAGLPMLLVIAIGVLFLAGGVFAYFQFAHVQARIDMFLDPSGEEAYQVARSLEAFRGGGIFGVGPGEGHVKEVLPDAHADFIFAVAGEEFGLLMTLMVVALFAFIVLRGFIRVFRDQDLFTQLAVAGLLVQFGLQAIINMASTLNLMPTKGMTLPFISYGGSSMFALALGMGMVLALTRDSRVPGRPR
ncbi:MAG: FtsW/RodA/SpoVE family cell cycle protein [Rhodospirillaceae bacterium]|nr:FtsW/RodA/SpoVE family cell cycle protein [Rhodospirillaceae bacterium]MBT5177867.1 FtsW/RodA/SpoVE family cell cycle protein [Rhodospirillaceae bacterium]